ncbi:hypothetical protein [Streptomyces sp. NPDC094049]|uniref:hypothetical protein n=1 Tax=Streptomyces sp. NPDC094049 TaxID=3154987 RepID=UPI00332FD154
MTTLTGPRLWVPEQDPAEIGFVSVLGGLYITGLTAPEADEDAHPVLFLALGHHRWVTVIQAADLYMRRVHDWTRWCLYPGDDPDEAIPRIPRALHTHAAIHCHPDGTSHPVWTRPDDPGALPVTAMRHPAAPTTEACLPDPDRDGQTATWTH